MERLHASDDPKLAEAWNVGNGDGFNVFDARAAIASVVPCFGIFIGIQCGAHSVVADRMREKLQAALVQLLHGRLVF